MTVRTISENEISTRHGVTWVGISQVGKVLMQLVSVFTLARILPSADFGLMALATTATAFAGVMRDMGTGAALIQKPELSGELKNAVFIFNAILGGVLTISLIALSPLLSILFKEPRLVNVLFILAPVFTIVSLGATHQALLERESLFKHIAIIELVSSFAGLASALFIALQGGGVYALVAQSIVAAGVATVFLWFFVKWRPVLSFNFSVLKEIFGFSGNIFLFGFVNYFQRNSDSMLIGRFLGVSDLGYYNVAYRLLLFPLQNITFVMSRAMFPAYSRNQHNTALIGKHYLETLESIAFITAPMMALMWALREPLISVFLGERWLPAASVLAWLAPVGFIQSLISTSGSVLNSIGRSDILRNLGLIGVPFLTLSFIFGLPWGIVGVAAAYCIANFFWIYPVVNTVLKLLSCSFQKFFSLVVKPTFISVLVALFIWYCEQKNILQMQQPLIELVVGILIGLTLYCVFSLIFMRNSVIKFVAVFQKKYRQHMY